MSGRLRQVLLAAVLLVLAMLSLLRLHPDSAMTSLFSRSDASAQALQRVLDHFAEAGQLLVLVRMPDRQPQPQRLLDFARRLKQKLGEDPQTRSLIGDVSFEADSSTQQFVAETIAPAGLLYLDDRELEQARQRLTLPQMREQFRQDQAMLAAPGPAAGALAASLVRDPLRLRDFLTPRLSGLSAIRTYRGQQAFISADGSSLLIQIAGARPPSDLGFCQQITDNVRRVAEAANTDHLELEFSGAYAIAAFSQNAIRRDSIESVIGSVLGLGLLLGISFRRPLWVVAIIFTPVLVGVIYGFGVYAWINPGVTPLTAVIGAMLAGIGVDYTIFSLVWFIHGSDDLRPIRGGLLAAWATSIVGFVAIGLSSVPMLRQFALAGSLCLSGVFVTAIFVLPVLLSSFRTGLRQPGRINLEPLIRWLTRWGRWTAAASVVVLLAAANVLLWRGPLLPLESDPAVLHPQPNPPLDAERDIAITMGGSDQTLILHLQAATEDDLLRLAYRANERLAKSPMLRSSFGLTALLPDPDVARQRAQAFAPAEASRVLRDFDTALADSPFAPSALAGYRQFLAEVLSPKHVPGIDDLLQHRQLARTLLPSDAQPGTVREAVTILFPRPTSSTAQRIDLVRDLRARLSGLEGAALTGIPVVGLDASIAIHRDLPRLIAGASLLIVVYLLLHFRSLRDSTLSILPTLCSLLIVMAVARLSGAKMNLANIVSAPLLISVDVDYGIFLVTAARQARRATDRSAQLAAAAQAVLLCGTATLLSFGSLVLTSVPAIRSLGGAVAIGVGSCAAASLFLLLPILLAGQGAREPD